VNKKLHYLGQNHFTAQYRACTVTLIVLLSKGERS